MKKKIKVVTVVGTRPELIRLSRTIKVLDENTNHVLIHTGQNYDKELSSIFFSDLKISEPSYQLNIDNHNPTEAISEILKKVDKILREEKPDAFIIIGDTNSCLSAYSAKRLKIPIFHIEAGNRCYDQRVPEEINRKIIDHISDINITYSEIAKQNLIRENISPDKIFKVGSPMHEVLNFYKPKIIRSKILKELKIKKNSYYLTSIHREENLDNIDNINQVFNFLNKLSERGKEKIIFSAHPRTAKKIKNLKIKVSSKILLLKPFNYSDYMNLQMNAKLVLSDSGSITEESSLFGFSAINLRSTNERQEGMSVGMVPMIKFDYEKVNTLIDFFSKNKNKNIVQDYLVEDFSNIFFKILLSYIDYINEYTWKKKK
jgi:UDP-N-acetylglucosamine 2-epimerase